MFTPLFFAIPTELSNDAELSQSQLSAVVLNLNSKVAHKNHGRFLPDSILTNWWMLSMARLYLSHSLCMLSKLGENTRTAQNRQV